MTTQTTNNVDPAIYECLPVKPLRRPAPRLTEAERLAIDWAAHIAAQHSQVAIHKTLRELLKEAGNG